MFRASGHWGNLSSSWCSRGDSLMQHPQSRLVLSSRRASGGMNLIPHCSGLRWRWSLCHSLLSPSRPGNRFFGRISFIRASIFLQLRHPLLRVLRVLSLFPSCSAMQVRRIRCLFYRLFSVGPARCYTSGMRLPCGYCSPRHRLSVCIFHGSKASL